MSVFEVVGWRRVGDRDGDLSLERAVKRGVNRHGEGERDTWPPAFAFRCSVEVPVMARV